MKITIHEDGQCKIAEVQADEIIIAKPQDALDLMVRPEIPSPKKIIVRRHNLAPSFFDLRSGLAGEVMQKFVNYGVQLAVVGDFSDLTSDSFKAFVIECNRGNQMCFVADVAAARKFLAA
jgi:hypothetical protein